MSERQCACMCAAVCMHVCGSVNAMCASVCMQCVRQCACICAAVCACCHCGSACMGQAEPERSGGRLVGPEPSPGDARVSHRMVDKHPMMSSPMLSHSSTHNSGEKCVCACLLSVGVCLEKRP